MLDLDWLDICRRVVAGQREIFGRYQTVAERTEFEGVGEGGDRTLVIDRLCEDLVFEELERLARAGHRFVAISEERGEVRFGEGEPTAWVVIDPIDGSLNARRTIPAHSFSLAVASGPAMTTVEFGFVHDFGVEQEFSARRGRGAEMNGIAIAVAPPRPPEARRLLEVVGLESADPEIAAPAIAALDGDVHRLRVIGSIAITACQVAAGRFDGMFSLRRSRSVDVAAAQLIVSEAGGVVSLGSAGVEGVGFGLGERFPVAAAADAARLEILCAAQRHSPGIGD